MEIQSLKSFFFAFLICGCSSKVNLIINDSASEGWCFVIQDSAINLKDKPFLFDTLRMVRIPVIPASEQVEFTLNNKPLENSSIEPMLWESQYGNIFAFYYNPDSDLQKNSDVKIFKRIREYDSMCQIIDHLLKEDMK